MASSTYLNFWVYFSLTCVCLSVSRVCLSVCQSALSLECLTSASSVTTLQPLGPLLRLTLHRGKRVSLAAASHTDSSSVCLYFPVSAYYIVCLSVTSKRTRSLADTVGSNWEPAAALGSFSRKPGLPGGNRATGGTAPSHRLVRPRLLPS